MYHIYVCVGLLCVTWYYKKVITSEVYLMFFIGRYKHIAGPDAEFVGLFTHVTEGCSNL